MAVTSRDLKLAIKTGDVVFGFRETFKLMEKKELKHIIYCSNCPAENVQKIQEFKDIAIKYEGTNTDLGSACGKPFPISVIGVINPGEASFQ